MTTLRASETRIPPESFNRVAYQGGVVRIEHRSGPAVYLVGEEDMALLRAVKERRFEEAADGAMARYDELLARLAR